MKIAFITPTKDRPDDIRKMLRSFESQTQQPDQVIVVDASETPVRDIVNEFQNLSVDYLRWDGQPSAAAQRNGGVEQLRDDIDLVCFFDDDQVLHPDAIEKMLVFWESKAEDKTLGAASFYDASWRDSRSSRFKKSKVSQWLGLYSEEPGSVAKSGWQSLYYGGVNGENLEVEWLSSQAIILKHRVLNEYAFDEFFVGYSYLEDLDFSYSISRKYRMTVVADAKFNHYHSPAGRGSAYQFGKIEVRNRHYIVKKHQLSMTSYRMAMSIRWLMSLATGQFSRALGNLAALSKTSR